MNKTHVFMSILSQAKKYHFSQVLLSHDFVNDNIFIKILSTLYRKRYDCSPKFAIDHFYQPRLIGNVLIISTQTLVEKEFDAAFGEFVW